MISTLLCPAVNWEQILDEICRSNIIQRDNLKFARKLSKGLVQLAKERNNTVSLIMLTKYQTCAVHTAMLCLVVWHGITAAVQPSVGCTALLGAAAANSNNPLRARSWLEQLSLDILILWLGKVTCNTITRPVSIHYLLPASRPPQSTQGAPLF